MLDEAICIFLLLLLLRNFSTYGRGGDAKIGTPSVVLRFSFLKPGSFGVWLNIFLRTALVSPESIHDSRGNLLNAMRKCLWQFARVLKNSLPDFPKQKKRSSCTEDLFSICLHFISGEKDS